MLAMIGVPDFDGTLGDPMWPAMFLLFFAPFAYFWALIADRFSRSKIRWLRLGRAGSDAAPCHHAFDD